MDARKNSPLTNLMVKVVWCAMFIALPAWMFAGIVPHSDTAIGIFGVACGVWGFLNGFVPWSRADNIRS